MFRFMWQPETLNSDILNMADELGISVVCDLGGRDRMAKAASLARLQAPPSLSRRLDFFIDGSKEEMLPEVVLQALCGILPHSVLWVEVAFLFPDAIQWLQRIAPGRLGWVVTSVASLEEICMAAPGERRFALKGSESGGFIGQEPLLTLFAAVRDWQRQTGIEAELHVWGGVASPEAAAAFLSSGATSIVFESLHWLTEQVGLPETTQKKIGKIQVDHTRVLGLSTSYSYRLFDKGNSTAAQTAATKADATEDREAALQYLRSHAVNPLSGRFDRREIIPVGVEAAFAASFVRRFGRDFIEAVKIFRAAVEHLISLRQEIAGKFADSPTAREWGTRYPFVQGAMSWITDVPEFAAKVAEAGALPTLAMGMMDPDTLQRKFDRISELMQGRPYAVNLIALRENPYRDRQLDWILRHRPRFAVLAAGEPAYGKSLLAAGIDAIYIAPTEDLLRLALEAGYRHIICEGCESGGHIGQHSTLTLAQQALDLKNRRPELFSGCTLILAGGVCNRETAYMAAMLGADAIQMGTAYLTANEIVITGALSELYRQQILESVTGGTVVTGESVGLRVRSLRSAKTEAILELERTMGGSGESLETSRRHLEELATGSLCLAARSLDLRTGNPVSPEEALVQGQFMSGICAGLLHEGRSLAELHAELASIAESPTTAPAVSRPRNSQPRSGYERIAITGMSLVNALGNSPAEIWEASLALRSGIVNVPPEKWNHDRYFDSRPMVSGKTYCRVAAFHKLKISRRDIEVPPQDFKNMTAATRIAFWVAQQAVMDSHILDSDIDRQKIGVILSQNVSEMTPISADLGIRDAIPDIIDAIRRVMPVTPEQAATLAVEIAAGRSIQDDASLLGRLSSMVPGFVCNKFGFTGPSYSVQAACSSSLVALHSAVQMMRTGVLDAALVGGGEEPLSALHFLEFSVLGALAGLAGQNRPPEAMSRPFDRQRDGFVMGEGAGMVVIERESVALRRGARIYGYITGVGASNTETGMVESSRHSQIRAMRASFEGLSYGPESVDLVECHATSTRQGDSEEVQALKSFYPANKQTVLAGFKSQIGHTLGAAGINSLIRGVMAMNAGVYPATLNFAEPDPEMHLEGSGLEVLTQPLPWQPVAGRPRRFQVDAFGFGGSNYVVQVEQDGGERESLAAEWPAGIQNLTRKIEGKSCRIAVIADTLPEAEQLWQDSGAVQNIGALTEKRRRSLSRQGIYIGDANSASAAAAAMIFPGQGSQYVGMGRELSEALPAFRRCLAQAGEYFGFDIIRLLFDSTEVQLRDTRWQQPAVFALEVALARTLMSLGFRPAALAGHSLGQFSALCIAGVFSFADGCRIVNQRALCMEKAGALAGDAGSMLAVHASREEVEPLLDSSTGVFVLNVNSPTQTVIGGSTDATLSVAEALSEQGLRWSRLPVGMAFHSPMFRAVQAEFAAFLSTIPFYPPAIPVVSNHTAAIFPAEPGEIRRLLAEHMSSPVDWLSNLKQLSSEFQISTFVEAGPREALGNLTRDTLPQARCLSLCLPSIELPCLRSAVAQLYVEGFLPESAPVMPTQPEIAVTASARLHEDSPQKGPLCRPVVPLQSDAGILEDVITVILQATGYERDEVEPDMDLREDLSIRSSRLPVIADALETRFVIKLDLQDFAGVRTVRDIAARIEALLGHRNENSTSAAMNTLVSAQETAASTSSEPISSLPRRILFSDERLPEGDARILQFSPLDRIGIVCPWGGQAEAVAAADVFRRDYGVTLVQVSSVEQAGDHLAGLLFWIGAPPVLAGAAAGASAAEVQLQLTDSFLLLQAFLTSKQKKAVFLFQSKPATPDAAHVLSEGILGMLLCMACEYRSVLFRSIRIEGERLADETLRRALDLNIPFVSLRSRAGGLYAETGQETPLVLNSTAQWKLSAADVVVISGGGAGILREWVRALVPFGCRIILLGRTPLAGREEEPPRAREIQFLLAELAAAGIEAAYRACDVADPAQVEERLTEMESRFGRITGVIHGAGILRDNYVPQISADDFMAVTNVKLQGAANLFQSAEKRGLRFFAVVSSVASVNGNPGQTNYAAANRALAAYVDCLHSLRPEIRSQAFLLGPVEGGGMADTAEIRALMRMGGYSYIHAAETAQLFCREMAFGDPLAGPVLLARSTPVVPTAPPLRPAVLEEGLVNLDFPLIDTTTLDLRGLSLVANRSFSAQKDLWLPDHRPMPFMKNPLVSGIMMLEVFAESARLLYPYLAVHGFRDIRFIDLIECPPGRSRQSRIDCRALEAQSGAVNCETQLHTQDQSPTGRELAHWGINSRGRVILGPINVKVPFAWGGFPVPLGEFTGQQLDSSEVLALYERYTALQGRYRVLDAITGIGADSVEVSAFLQETVDFADHPPTRYQAMPYLLEAIFHAVDFQTLLTMGAEREKTIVIPYAFSAIDFHRSCSGASRYRVQAHRRSRNESGVVWDAVAFDSENCPALSVQGLEMRCLSR